MSSQAREALQHLTAALEAHLEAVEARRSATDASVDDAFDALVEAFERYEDELDAGFGESLPFVLDEEIAEAFEDSDEDDEDEEDEEDDEDDDEEDDVLVTVDALDGHATEDEDELDDDIETFDLR